MSVWKILNDAEKITPYRLLMMMAWISTPILYYLNIYLSRMNILFMKGSILIPLLYIVLIIASFRELNIKLRNKGIVLYVIFSIIYLMTFALFPQNSEHLEEESSAFFFNVLPFIFVGLFLDINRFQNSFTWLSVLSIITHVLYQTWYVAITKGRTGLIEDMVGAYLILPHVLFLVWMAVRNRSVISIGIASLSVLFLFAMGNRGSFVCMAVFFLLLIMVPGIVKKKASRILFIVLGLIVITNSQQIALFLSNLFPQYGLSNRTFDMILSNEFLVSKGRDDIRSNLVAAIWNGPMLGYGLCGDRVIAGVSYAHNFFLEIIVDFGLFLGPLICISYIIICIKAYRSCFTREEYAFLSVLLANFIGLMFSGSFILDYQWAFLLGYSIRLNNNRRAGMMNNSLSLA